MNSVSCLALRVCCALVLPLAVSAFVGCSDSSSDGVAGGVTDIGNSVAFAGEVLDDAGKPVAKARVVAYYDGWSQTSVRDSVETLTDEKGAFELKVDSGVSAVLFASFEDDCGLAKIGDDAGNMKISIGASKRLKSRMSGKSGGYMRVVGSDLKAELSKDGSFEFRELPPGDISLVFVEEGSPRGRLEFTTVGSDDSIEIPDLVNGNADDWLLISDFRYYRDSAYAGINVTMPDVDESVLQKLRTYDVSVSLPAVDESLDGIVVPVKIATEGFAEGEIDIRDASGRSLAFEVDFWDAEEAVAWVRLDSLSANSKSVSLKVVPGEPSTARAFDAQDVAAVLHLNGDAKVLNHDFSEAASFTDSVGFIGAGFTPGQGQFIDMNYLDPCAGDFTLSLWTKWSGPNGNHQVLFSQREYWSDSTSRFQWHFEANRGWFAVMKSMPNYPEAVYFGDSLAVPVNEWAHLAVVSKDRMLTMYVNGESLATVDENGETVFAYRFVPNELKQAVPFRIGGNEIDEESWNGAIDEVRIETVARSADWIRAAYETQRAVGGSK